MPDIIDITQVAPVTDAEAARLASPAVFSDLARQITASPVPESGPRRAWSARRARSPRDLWSPSRAKRRALLLGGPLAVLAAVAALLVTLLTPGDNGPDGQAAIQAVSFIRDNGHITVIIRNLYADTSWYNADLARHHVDITLHLAPVPPSLVGYINILESGSGPASFSEIKPITKLGSCGLQGTDCQIGFTIPDDFHGQASMWIGRPARPGEQYQVAGSAFNRGEPLYGLTDQIFGHPLSEVRPVLAQHHVTVAQCREEGIDNPANGGVCDPSNMPANWYVRDVAPWAPNQVLLTIGPLPYPASGSVFTAGEPLAGLQDQIIGHPLGEVLPLFAQHDVTVIQCYAESADGQGTTSCDPSNMPRTWFIHDVSTNGGNQVIVVIGQEKSVPGTGH
jgi:hypothetical protein